MIKAIISDIEGTLTPEIAWTKLTEELGGSKEVHLKLFEDFQNDRISYEDAKQRLVAMWRSRGIPTKSSLGAMFEKWPLREGALELFRYFKTKGYITCLITGSLDLYAEVIAKRLGVDAWYATAHFVWSEKSELADFIYERHAAKKKVEYFLEFCKENSLQPQECIALGDDKNDLELFKLTGRGIAVESPTSQALDSVAWKKVKELSEIKQILESVNNV